MSSAASSPIHLPRVAITYCTQCRWMLRAAYFGQELLSTFGTEIGEIALIPATGGLFQVELTYAPGKVGEADTNDDIGAEVKKVLLWDRKTEGGFPETKVLKQRVRDHIEPGRDLGHSDVGGKKKKAVDETGQTITEQKVWAEGKETSSPQQETKRNPDGTVCEDCK